MNAWATAGENLDNPCWQALERHSRPLLHGAPLESVASLLSAISRAGRRPSAAWLSQLQEELVVTAQSRSSPAVEAWAAALMAVAKAGAVDRRFAQVAMADTAPQLPAATPPGVSQLLWGVAKARCVPSAPWLRALRTALSARARGMSPAQLACCLRSLAVLAERVEEDELRGPAAVLAGQLAERHEGTAPDELAQALWALARLGLRASNDAGCFVASLLLPIMEQLPRLTARQLSSLLWALAKLDARVAAPASSLLVYEATAQMPAMTNKEFSQSIWALAKLLTTPAPGTAPAPARRPAPPPAPFVERLWQQAHLRSGRLAPGESTLLLWAVSRLGLDPPPRWLAGELAAEQRALPSYRADQLSNTVVALARMGRAPPAAWMAAFESSSEARLGEFGLQEIVNVLWAFTAFGHTPSLPWQHACVLSMRAACGDACGQAQPFAADAVGALLEEAGLLGALAIAVAAQAAEGGGEAEGASESCPLSLGFELPTGCA